MLFYFCHVQRSCVSCWAFSATGAIEGQWARRHGQLISLSEQNLVDCTRKYGNHGCQGGWMANAFRYVRNNKGINTAADYPYTATRNKFVVTIRRFRHIKRNTRNLKKAVKNIGPIAVAIDASGSFRWYKRGGGQEKRGPLPSGEQETLQIDIAKAVGSGSVMTNASNLVPRTWRQRYKMCDDPTRVVRVSEFVPCCTHTKVPLASHTAPFTTPTSLTS
ncbi:cathepsin L-like isoform X2 [Scyliorhinus canicula]|uniref:cathepsin L-like isoform X2 n=1 Tax=Scyliorhinus canicula TaxID=7830 RepID=UPI0018F326F7|nr:cathepsin L-like isoform X2 [Scyliorhinus canicula]